MSTKPDDNRGFTAAFALILAFIAYAMSVGVVRAEHQRRSLDVAACKAARTTCEVAGQFYDFRR